jgi:hypothetical protein
MKIMVYMSKYDPNEIDGLTLLQSAGVNWVQCTRKLEDIQQTLADLYRDNNTGKVEIDI